jgi:hypothetical protein
MPTTTQELGELIKEEIDKWSKVAAYAKIVPN